MIMKILAILSLILVFWCHQSHHHIFLLINTGPLSLASEEFISVSSEVVPNAENVPSNSPQEATGSGSQIDEKSDSVVISAEVDKLKHTEKSEQYAATGSDGASDGAKSDNQGSKSKDPLASNDKQPVNYPHGDPSSAHHFGEKDGVTENADVSNTNSATRVNEDVLSHLSGLSGDSLTSEDDLSKLTEEKNNSLTDNRKTAESANLATDKPENGKLENESHSVPTKVEPPSSNTPVPASTPQKEDEPIPSFMEWTQIQQQKLHESNLANGATGSGHAHGQNGHRSPHSGSLQQNKSSLTGTQAAAVKSSKESSAKNFASPDCGAKVILSNPESQNANGVLSSSHDEYMLNKCGIPIWFIVELCEPLKIEKVSLGNLELFSSSPKDIEIGISDRYPTRDWSKLGPFTLPDHRAIHSINLPATNASTFGKFLRVNILSHYGDEHFCPMSLVRVNGISEYEVLESENTHPEDIDATDKEEGALYEEPVISEQSQKPHDGNTADKSVFGTAKDAVINIVRKVAQVVVKSDNTKDASRTEEMPLSGCRSLLQCLPSYETDLRDNVLSLLSCNFSNLLPFLSKNLPWCGWDYCHALFSKHSIGLPWQPEGFFASMFGGPGVLHALCNYHRPLIKESCATQFITNVSATSSTDVLLEEGIINETVRTPPVKLEKSTEEIPEKGSDKIVPETVSTDKHETIQNKENGHRRQAEADQTVQASVESKVTPEGGEPQKIPVPPSPTQTAPTGNVEEVTSAPTNPPPQTNTQQQQHQHQAGSVQQQQQKESVFVRLSNRIKTLERNQTLTASYLEELSRRFKKQNEENHNVNEGAKTFINESRVKFKVLEDLYRFELRSLRRNTDEIRERLFNVQLQRSVLILLCLLQFVGIVCVCIWVRKRFRHFESQMQRMIEVGTGSNIPPAIMPPPSRTSSISNTRNETPPHNILGMRKRLNSDMSTASSLNSIDKSKKIKKKKKKLPDLKPVNVKASGPASAPVPEYSRKPSGESEFKFDYPPLPSASSAYDVVSASYNYKENINPQTPKRNSPTSALQTTPTAVTPNGSGIPGSALLSTQVDSPFQMISSTSTNFFVDSGVSTSSRFALLASPGPGNITTKVSGMNRSGSLTSLDSSSTSSYSAKTGSHSIVNGHGDSQSQGSNGSGKKRKNKGLKALMPKIFDR